MSGSFFSFVSGVCIYVHEYIYIYIYIHIEVVSTVCMKELKVNGCAFSAYSGSKG